MKALKNTPVSTLPISKKAYVGFTERIRQVFAMDTAKAGIMIGVLDRYLDGDIDAPDTLDDSMRMAFEFLRHDVDLAIERSRRARERARLRREAKAAADPCADAPMDRATFEKKLDECMRKYFTIVDDDDFDDSLDNGVECSDKNEAYRPRPLTRRERRARERATRGKSRIKPLGVRVG